ncbi:MAG: ABC transporter ATP-binding protein [Clostridiales bacterium]|nr:ABC transporter ATP-binding protein [Clostridiales bacterium]
MSDIICKAEDLCVDFKIKRKAFGKPDILSAVRKVNLEIRRGETFGLVGESGCGKTTLANAFLHFVPISDGSITLNGVKLDANSTKADWLKARKGVQMIFQDPFGSLNPRFQVWQLISEPMLLAGESDEHIRRDRAGELLEMVGLSSKDAARNVFEFSGGQRQRIAIARALSINPSFIVCDEPTSALDVSVHAQICNLLLDLQDKYGLTYLFITHNLALVRHLTDRMAVMYMGQIMESGSTDEIFAAPQHPYTKALLSAILEADPTKKQSHIRLTGEVASPINAGDSCRFAPRCYKRCNECTKAAISPIKLSDDHITCCPYSDK